MTYLEQYSLCMVQNKYVFLNKICIFFRIQDDTKFLSEIILIFFFADNLRMAAVWAMETDLQPRIEDGTLLDS